MGLFGCGRINKIVGAVFTSAVIVALNPMMVLVHPVFAQTYYNWANTGWMLLFLPMLQTRPTVAFQVAILTAIICALGFAQVIPMDSLLFGNTVEFVVFFGWALGLMHRPKYSKLYKKFK